MVSGSPPSRPPLRLGPFALHRPIARGGMGAIWRGEHLGQGLPVAVKVMVADELQSATFRQAFRVEAWAMARLDHRGIVAVHDQGQIPAAVADASLGLLQEGSPYLVMDLVDGGVLSDRPARSFWELKKTLLLLLDALAHAHARGVVHRDLKPANVLLDPQPLRSGGLQLTDFGIAHAAEQSLAAQDPGDVPVMGTLQYMAPEQLDGRWRDFGPATDLYALGCIAWELATGALPFVADDPLELMDLHLDAPPPDLAPRFAVPDGFADWLSALLRKEPYARPARAADAARDLKQLGAPDREAVRELGLTMADGLPSIRDEDLAARPRRGRAPDPAPEEPDLPLGLETLPEIARVGPPTDEAEQTLDEEDSRGPGARLAQSWRRHRRPRPFRPLAGAGLGLWGLRAPPLLGRDDELDALWGELAAVHQAGRARAVLVAGDLGVGSSRLALWLAERAHELGVADVLWATHGPRPSASDGLGRLLARELRCVGLPAGRREDALTELLVRRALASETRAASLGPELARWVDPGREELLEHGVAPGEDPDRPRFRSLYTFLGRLARRRPVLLWFDDAQWGAEALAFADYVLRAQDETPAEVLVVASLRADAADADARATSFLRVLGAHPDVRTLSVRPLLPALAYDLCRDGLGLGAPLAARVAEASEGVPLFAVELVGEWARQGVLEPTALGWRLRDRDVAIPASLPALWDDRVDRAIAGLPADAERALALAAAFGGRVQRREFAAACAELGVAPPAGLVDRLYARQLAVPSKGGWSFVHDALRLALERRAGATFPACVDAALRTQARARGAVTTTPTAVPPLAP